MKTMPRNIKMCTTTRLMSLVYPCCNCTKTNASRYIIATILALLVMLPFASAAINAGTGSLPAEPERASSVQVFSFGENAIICVNCPALTTAPEPGLASSTLASYVPRVVCKGDTPCVIYTGLKFKEAYNPAEGQEFPFIVATKDAYKKDKPLMASSGQNVRLEDAAEGELVVDSANNKVYTVENPQKIILQNAKAYINNFPVGTGDSLAGTLTLEEQERLRQIQAAEEEQGQILKIRGLDKRAPNQLIGDFSIPLKKGDTLTFEGLFGEKEYSLEQPVLNIGRFTDNEDDSTAEDRDADDWLDELDSKFLDSDKDRSELKICNKKFVNYYAGSAFELKANEGRCEITEYMLNTELFEEDDADDNKLFTYSCGEIVFEAAGGNARNLYCNQEDVHNAVLSCGKDGMDDVCTGAGGKTKIKIRVEPGAFEIDNTQGYMFQSIKEVTSEEQKAYHFLIGKLKIRTHPQSENPLRYDLIFSLREKPLVVTYKDSTAMGASTITLPENTVVSRLRGAQIFSYMLKQADYKGVLGEGLHQINLIYPEAIERNEETSTKIREAKTRGATRADIALLGAAAEEKIEVSSPNTHLYDVTPLRPGQEESAVEAQTITPQATAASATTLGAYAYRHCFRAEPPAELKGAAREATEKIAQAMLETNPGISADTEDILNTPIPAGASLSLPGTTTEYRLGSSIVRVRLNSMGCFGLSLSSPAITGEQCMEKPGAVVKCMPASRQNQCTTVYQEGEGVKACQENNVCCEVKLAQAGEYCVKPEAGASLSNGAKCSAMCGSAVSNAEYGRIGAERVEHCAEGLVCCKSSRRSSAPSAAVPARARDDSACTNAGGKCITAGKDLCFREAELRNSVPAVREKCLSSRAPNYMCCETGFVDYNVWGEGLEPEAPATAAPTSAAQTRTAPAQMLRISPRDNKA